MSCPHARDTDFAAFAADRRAPEWAALRAHYPVCGECAAEVARWSRLVGGLREEGARVNGHPSEEQLLAYESDPGSLAPAERASLRAHLEGCAPCRSELRVLTRFDFGALAEARKREGERGGWLAWLSDTLFGGALAPAYALAALVAIALPALVIAGWLVTRGPDEMPPVARNEQVPRGPEPIDPPARTEAPRAPLEIATEEPTEPASPDQAAPATQVAKAPAAAPRTTDALVPPPTPTVPEPAPTAPAGGEEATILVAALLPSDLPRYLPDAALAGGSLEPVRIGSIVRAGGPSLPALRVLAPDHVAATADAAPAVYWHLSAPSAVPVEITVVSDDEAAPVVERWLDPPVAAGLHVLRVSEHGVTLEPGTTYQLFVALVPDPDHREADVIASAALRYVPPAGEARARLAAAAPAERAHALAGAGYWLDAFATYTKWIAAEPDARVLREQRAALLDQVGLGAVALESDAPAGT